MKCKYCGAEFDETAGGEPMWQCGTYQSHNDKRLMQSLLCQKNELNRYRAMFPIPPWDGSPITPEVCERLGLANEHDEWWTDSLPCGTSVRISDRGVWVNGEGYGLKAGQLACLIAARRAST